MTFITDVMNAMMLDLQHYYAVEFTFKAAKKVIGFIFYAWIFSWFLYGHWVIVTMFVPASIVCWIAWYRMHTIEWLPSTQDTIREKHDRKTRNT